MGCECGGHGHDGGHKKGKKLIVATVQLVDSYLATLATPPSLDELQNIIRTVHGTLKDLKEPEQPEESKS
ncbi:MAG: hypothetical protein WCP97_02965 [bacterium]